LYLDNHQARLGTKGELLMNRDLTKYLNQLRRAKLVCERRITANGGRSYLLVDASTNKINLANRKVKFGYLSLSLTKEYLDTFIKYHTELYHWSTLSSSILRNIWYTYISQVKLFVCSIHFLYIYYRFWYDIWKLRSGKFYDFSFY
jgi:hypothetical protein